MSKNNHPTHVSDPLQKIIADLRRKMEQGHFDPPDTNPTQEAARKSLAKLSWQLGDKYSFERASIVSYQTYHPEQKKLVKRLTDILEKLPTLIHEGRNIVWYGTVGTGKDHLCCSLLYAAAQLGFDVEWRNVQRLNETSRDRMKHELPERGLIEEMLRPSVLALSDPIPPKGQPSDWNANLIYRVLDERGRHLRGTWITLNVTTAETAEKEIKEALSVPVWDRMREQAELLPCFWPSFRGRRGQ